MRRRIIWRAGKGPGGERSFQAIGFQFGVSERAFLCLGEFKGSRSLFTLYDVFFFFWIGGLGFMPGLRFSIRDADVQQGGLIGAGPSVSPLG